MELFRRKRICLVSAPPLVSPVKRHASCPAAPKPQRSRAKAQPQETGFLLTDLFQTKRLRAAPSRAPKALSGGGGPWSQPEGRVGEKRPLLGEDCKAAGADASNPEDASHSPSLSLPAPELASPAPEEPPKAMPPSAAVRLLGSSPSDAPKPVTQPPWQALPAAMQDLPKAGAIPTPLQPAPRMFWTIFGNRAKEAAQRQKESKYVQTHECANRCGREGS
ncbi:uncharacterized protein LOC133372411 isoform X1 [Rhineura floridana]|uniref:uncharacterized protein LOC133372411 isoform X1 n=1 Tax=Rhineura floridana TaxID=261503 RepID=UPI002AC7F676|nr:uncharacterized protein LOC133372411 isoform X1 [Rhineura floridana]